MTPVVTPEKVKKPVNPRTPSPTKMVQKKKSSANTKPPARPKSPSKKAPSKPLKVPATIMIEAASEAPKTSRREPLQELAQKEARKNKKEYRDLRKSRRLNA